MKVFFFKGHSNQVSWFQIVYKSCFLKIRHAFPMLVSSPLLPPLNYSSYSLKGIKLGQDTRIKTPDNPLTDSNENEVIKKKSQRNRKVGTESRGHLLTLRLPQKDKSHHLCFLYISCNVSKTISFWSCQAASQKR